MTVRQKAVILITYFQYLGLILSVKIEWSTLFEYFDWTEWLFVDINIPIPLLPQFDFRVKFTAIVVLLPLLFTLLLLLLFKSWEVVVWYFTLLFGLILVLIGWIPRYVLPDDDLSTIPPQDDFITVGVVIVIVCMVLFAIRWANSRLKSRSEGPGVSQWTTEQLNSVLKYAPRPSTLSLTIRFLLGVILVVFGVHFLDIWTIPYVPKALLGSQFAFAFAITLIIIGGLLLIHTLICLFHGGRQMLLKLTAALRSVIIMVVLLALLVVYIPIISTLLSAFFFVVETCDKNTEFPNRTVEVGLNPDPYGEGSSICRKCPFLGVCPTAMWGTVCHGGNDYRLAKDITLSLPHDILPYYIPAALIMLAAFVFGLPYLFYRLVEQCTEMLAEMPSPTVLAEEEEWTNQTATTKSSAKMLFASFEKRWRFFLLIEMFQKMLLVAVFVFLVQNARVALGSMLVIHMISFLFGIYASPFISRVEDVLNSSTSFCAALTSAFGISLVTMRDNIPSWVPILIISVNALLPLLVLVIGILLLRQRESEAAKKRKEIAARAKAEAQQAYDMSGGYRAVVFAQQVEWQMNAQYGSAVVAPMPPIAFAAAPQGAASPSAVGIYTSAPVAVVAVSSSAADAESPPQSRKAFAEGPPPAAVEEEKRRRLQIILVDRKINQYVLRMMTNFFMFTGVLAFCALCFCLIGLLFATNPDLIPGRPLRSGSCSYFSRFEFASYSSWSEFTNNCCCKRSTPHDTFSVIELWYCRNGRFKERIRQESGARDDGRRIRGLCEGSFAVNVTLPFCEGGHFRVRSAPGVASDYVQKMLW